MPRLVLEGLSKSFTEPSGRPVPALADFSLALEERELAVVVGPSGCGKTTLLRLIAGLETPDRGTVRWGERDLTGQPPDQRDIAMVFQHHALLPHLTVAQNLGLGLRLRGVPRAQRERQVRETAELLGLERFLPRLPRDLSGGERQRVALGRAMIRRPAVFLFDEPLASLDPPVRAQLRHEIRRVHEQTGAVSLYVTHDQTEAMALGRRMALLHGGRLQQVGAPRDLYDWPAHRTVAAFLGSPPMNLLPGRLESEAHRLLFVSPTAGLKLVLPAELAGPLSPAAGKAMELGFRPEHAHLTPPDLVFDRLRLGLGRVLAVEPSGPKANVLVQIGSQVVVALVAIDAPWQPRSGDAAALELEDRHLRWFGDDGAAYPPSAAG